MTTNIPNGTRVVITEKGDHHCGQTGVVITDNQHSVSRVLLGSCRHFYHNSHLVPESRPDVIQCAGYADGDRVLWTLGPAYGIGRGAGAIEGFARYNHVLYATVRFDDSGLDNEDIPLSQLVKEPS